MYSFCVSTGGQFVFSSCGSSFDTWLRIFTAGLGREVTSCDDCGSCGLQTVLEATLDVGCYDLVIDAYNDRGGVYNIEVCRAHACMAATRVAFCFGCCERDARMRLPCARERRHLRLRPEDEVGLLACFFAGPVRVG